MISAIVRLIGESDIVDIDLESFSGATNPKLMGLDAADRINLLGHWLDQDRGEALVADSEFRSAMTAICGSFVMESDTRAAFDGGANFVLMTILRQKWPVGSKARFQETADRVGAKHTYLAQLSAAAKLIDLGDEAALKEEETRQLMMAVPNFKRIRKQFANSSAVQQLIKQGG